MMKRYLFCVVFALLAGLLFISIYAPTFVPKFVKTYGFAEVAFNSMPPRSVNPVYVSITLSGDGALKQGNKTVTISNSELVAVAAKISIVPASVYKEQFGKDLASFDGGNTDSLVIDGKRICCQVSEFPATVSAVIKSLNELSIKYFSQP